MVVMLTIIPIAISVVLAFLFISDLTLQLHDIIIYNKPIGEHQAYSCLAP
jgi:hypothetical protein